MSSIKEVLANLRSKQDNGHSSKKRPQVQRTNSSRWYAPPPPSTQVEPPTDKPRPYSGEDLRSSLAMKVKMWEKISKGDDGEAMKRRSMGIAVDRKSIEDGNVDVLIFARCKMGFDQCVMWHNGWPSPFYFTNTACWL